MPKAEDTRADPDAEDHVEAMLGMARRRGYITPAYELYGGTAGFYEYGPLGAQLKLNFENLWRERYVQGEGFAEIHSPTISPEPVFKASGHLGSFADLLIECPACKEAVRADHCLHDEYTRIQEELDAVIGKARAKHPEHGAELDRVQELLAGIIETNANRIEHHADEATVRELLCIPADGGKVPEVTEEMGAFTVHYLDSAFRVEDEDGKTLFDAAVQCAACGHRFAGDHGVHVYQFNLMFKTNIGPGSARAGYLRPETAQGMFVNFPWLYRYFRERLPFGAVQLGKAYRNEIAPRQALIRLREFHQAEVEYFVDPEEKDHPRFAEVADIELPLVPDGADPGTWRLGDAVDKGVIGNSTIAYFIAATYGILTDAGVAPDRIRFRQHLADEMAHYASDCWDAEYHSARYGWIECVGIADRGCYDLESHEKESGQQLAAFRRFDEPVEREVTTIDADMGTLGPLFKGRAKAVADACAALDADALPDSGTVEVELDGETVEVPRDALTVETAVENVVGEHVTPHVVEPSYGVDRILFAVLEHVYDPSGEWAVMRLPAGMAPLKCGVFPLLGKDGLPEAAEELDRALRAAGIRTYYDEGGSIGRRYARMDEVGTPFCVTVDHQTLEGEGVTIRERDSQEQVRVPLDRVVELVGDLVGGRRGFGEIG